MKLFRFECRKLLGQKYALTMIAGCILLMILSALQSAGYLYEWSHPEIQIREVPAYTQNIFAQYGQPYSEAFASAVAQEQQRLRDERAALSETDGEQPGKYGMKRNMDAILFSPLNRQTVLIQQIIEKRQALKKQAEQIAESSADPVQQKKAAMILSDYNQNLRTDSFYQDGTANLTERYLYASEGSFQHEILTLLLCFLFAGLFSGEHSTGMYAMIYAAKYGRGRLFSAKLAAAAFLTLMLTAVFFSAGWIVFSARYCGIHGLSSSLQLLEIREGDFALCPFSVTNGAHFMILFAMLYLWNLLTVVTLALFSIILKKPLYAMTAAASAGIGCIVLMKHAAADSYQIPEILLSGWFPAWLLHPYRFFSQFDTVTLFGHPVYSLYVLTLVTVALIMLMIVFNYRVYCKHFLFIAGRHHNGAQSQSHHKKIRKKDRSV